jgi:hypothetical protein
MTSTKPQVRSSKRSSEMSWCDCQGDIKSSCQVLISRSAATTVQSVALLLKHTKPPLCSVSPVRQTCIKTAQCCSMHIICLLGLNKCLTSCNLHAQVWQL